MPRTIICLQIYARAIEFILMSSFYTVNERDSLASSPESGLVRLLRSLHRLSPICLLLQVYSTSFAEFITKFKMEALRKFCAALVLLPTLNVAQVIGVAAAANIIGEWSYALKYEQKELFTITFCLVWHL